MAQQREYLHEQTVTATVVGHGTTSSGNPTVQLHVHEWKEKFKLKHPTTLYNVDDEHVQALPIKATVRVRLGADNLRTGKDGQPEKGDKPFHYFWSVIGIEGDVPAAPAAAPAQQEERGIPGAKDDAPPCDQDAAGLAQGDEGGPVYLDQDTSIRRSVALKAAVDYLDSEVAPDEVCETAELFERWLGRPV